MRTHTSRIWSVVTLLLVATFAGSFSLTQPAVAKQGPDDDRPARVQGEGNADKAAPAWLAAAKSGELVSYAEPDEVTVNTIARQRAGAGANERQIEAEAAKFRAEWSQTNYHGPNPSAFAKLQRNEERALAANSSPAALGLAVTGTLRLLTVLIEFNGTDSVTDFVHPVSVADRTCITETLTLSGPLHNQIAAPGPRDNYTFWRPSFERDYYEKLISSSEGITERVRLDLTDPEDGKAGINIAGYTMRNYYAEQSGNRVQFDTGPKGVIGWVQLPHSEAYYAADACVINAETGEYEAGSVSSMEGLPQNPFGGPEAVAADVISLINTADPNFPWRDYDLNGDGNIDHIVFVHAGEDRARGGPFTAHWAHRGSLAGDNAAFVAKGANTPDPSDDIRMTGYTMQYEALDLGVLAHEFGHDLGYPDLYSSNNDDSESSVVFFDLMSTASNMGKLGGFPPGGLSAWTKFALGWTDPKVVAPGTSPTDVLLGQSSKPPAGSTQAVRVDLPANELTYTELLPGSTQAYWTNNDQDWADVRLTRDVDLTGQTGAISMSFDIDYIIEEDWDYLFVEVSIDGGQTYTQTKGFEVGTGTELTTPDNYGDPNGRLQDYGGLRYGYTGSSGGWLRAYHDLSAYAGQAIKVRIRYATDEAFLERGAFIDNIAVTSGSAVLLSDPVEGSNANGWTPTVATFVPGTPLGAGWVFSEGFELKAQYYLVEWRNFDGFDKALRFAYHTIFAGETPSGAREFRVELLSTNLPGMLVWLRDTRFGNDPLNAENSILDSTRYADDPNFASPSEGPKGGLLIVDANYQPLRGPFNSTIDLGYGASPYPPFDNWNGRVQNVNAAFSLQSTPPLTLTYATGTISTATTILTPTRYAPLPQVSGFHDAQGYFPGVEALPEPVVTYSDPTAAPFLRIKPYAFIDPDASVVIPAKGYYPPRTPPGFTGRGAETSPPASNVSTFETIVVDSPDINIFFPVNVGGVGGTNVVGAQSGNPGDYGVQYGNHFVILGQATDGSSGTVRFYNAERAANISGSINATLGAGKPVTVTVNIENTGGPAVLTAYSDFDESQATYIEGSATNGAVPVRASQAQVEAALKSGGIAAVRAMAVTPSAATAVVWTSPNAMPSGAKASFSYALSRNPGYQSVRVVNTVYGTSLASAPRAAVQFGTLVYLPITAR
ncbi:MAG: immune inhibitor A [Chloroflexales bacterium]|nr:immune inhibitor A [Chloroflexales bacterium]